MDASPLPSRGPRRGYNCYVTLAVSRVPNADVGRESEVAVSPLPSRGPKRGRNCYVTPAFLGVPTPSVGRKSEVATSPLASWGPRNGRNCYVTFTFSGVPNAKHGEEIRSGCLTPAFSEAHNWAELRCHPCIFGGPQRQAREENQKWLPPPCLLGGPKEGGIATSPLHSQGSTTPSVGRKSEVATSPLVSRRPTNGRNC